MDAIDAPLAKCEFDDISDESNDSWSSHKRNTSYFTSHNPSNPQLHRSASDPYDLGLLSSPIHDSLQDLVTNFDKNIFTCFKNYDVKTETIAPVHKRTEQDVLSHSQTWWTLTAEYGNFHPVLSEPASNLRTQLEEADEDGQTCDDVVMTHHDSSSSDVPNADDVIYEIDRIMSMSHTAEILERSLVDSGHMTPMQPELRHFTEHYFSDVDQSQALNSLSTLVLEEFKSQLEMGIQRLSEVLVTELAAREDLDFEKELKDQMVTLLINVQKKKRQLAKPNSRNQNVRSNRRWSWTGIRTANQNTEPQLMNTTIPYRPEDIKLEVPHLQIYNKILGALLEDSPQVTALLTDYLLKVYAPPTNTQLTSVPTTLPMTSSLTNSNSHEVIEMVTENQNYLS